MNETLTIWINVDWNSPAADVFFTWLSSKAWFSFPLLILFGGYLILNDQRDGWKLFVGLILAVGCADQLGGLLKDLIAHPRPCFEIWPKLINPLYDVPHPCGSELTGMPSNHAANFAAGSAFVTMLWRFWRWSSVFWISTILVAVSRVYLGQHYPSQIAAGIALGSLVGLVFGYLAHRWLLRKT